MTAPRAMSDHDVAKGKKRRSKLKCMLDDAAEAGLIVTKIIDKGYGRFELVTQTPQISEQEKTAEQLDNQMQNAFARG